MIAKSSLIRRVLVGVGGTTIAGSLALSAHAQAPVASPCSLATHQESRNVVLTSDGYRRSAVLHTPNAATGSALPLLIAYHGYGGSGAEFEHDTGFSTLANQSRFVVVYPNARGVQWDISGPTTDDDFTRDLIKSGEASTCINASRIYATGVSNGAGMAARVTCDLSSYIAGSVPIAGGYKSLPACQPSRPESVLEIHGTNDTTVPYAGEGPTHAGAALAYAFAWAERDGCAVAPTKANIAPHTVLYVWNGCAGEAVVEQMTLYGVGHGMPEAPGSHILAPGPPTISGALETWRFLSQITLADTDQ